MSYTLSTVMPSAPTPGLLLNGFNHTDLRVEEAIEFDAPWPGGYLHVYRWGISTRSVELSHDDGKLDVRIMSGSTAEDHHLAFGIVRRAATLGGTGIVEPEDAEPITLDILDQQWDAGWIDRQVASFGRIVEAIIDAEGKTLTLPGPVRDFHVGPRLLAELRAIQDETPLSGRLHAAMRHVQYLDDVFEANVLVATKDDQSHKVVVWSSDCYVLFPRADRVCLHTDGPLTLLPFDAIGELAGARARRIDEWQYLVQPIPDAEWPSLVERAAQYRVN